MRFYYFALIVLLTAILSHSAHAQTWTDTTVNANFATAGSWSTGTVPGSNSVVSNADIATYAGTGTATTIGMNFSTLGTPYYLGTLQFTSAVTQARTLGSSTSTPGTLVLNGSGANNLILDNQSTNRLMTVAPLAGGSGAGLTLQLTAANSTINAITGTATGGIVVSAPITESVAGRGLTIGGGATVTLSGNNSFTGNVVVNGVGSVSYGALILGNNNALGTGSSTIRLNGGTVTTPGIGTFIQLNSGVTITGKTLEMNAATGRNSLFFNSGSGSATWAGNIVVLSPSVGNGNALYSNTSGGTLNVGVSGGGNTIVLNAPLLVRGEGTGIIHSLISGSSGIIRTDLGLFTLANIANTYSGSTAVSGGILAVPFVANNGTPSSIGTGSSLSLGQGGVGPGAVGHFRFTGTSDGSTNRSINIPNGTPGGGAILESSVSNVTLTLAGNITTGLTTSLATLTFTGAGNITHTANIPATRLLDITKTGAGTFIMSGSYGSTGTFAVSAGTARINGTLASTIPVSVTATGTLGGTGTINGTLSVASTARIAPGNSAGTLTIAGATTIAGRYEYEQATAGTGFAATPANGASSPSLPHTNHDVIVVNNTVNATGMVIDPISLVSTGFDNTQYYSWTVLTSTGLTGTPTLGTPSGADFSSLGAGNFFITTDTNNIYLNFTPVPEPATMLGATSLALFGGAWLRRRLKSTTKIAA